MLSAVGRSRNSGITIRPGGDADRLEPRPPHGLSPGRLLAGDGRDRLPDDVGDGLGLGDHDHVGSLDLGDGRPGALGHGTDDVAAGGLVTGAHDGRFFQPGVPLRSVNPAAATGRWVAAMTAACSSDRSAAKASWNLAGSMANSTAVPVPCPAGYCSWSRAVFRTLSVEPPSMSERVSPSSGAKAAT